MLKELLLKNYKGGKVLMTEIKKPGWLTVKFNPSSEFSAITETLTNLDLVTVCEESSCPNMSECWNGGTATFMILGDTCTRACKFCHVKTGFTRNPPDPDEPGKLVVAAKKLKLKYVVVTSVDRDDLPDQGSNHFARCITALKNSGILVEVLIPDFRGDLDCLKRIIAAKPDVIAHNIETTKRLQSSVRDPRANYNQSLNVLKNVKDLDHSKYTKSSIMLGLGETKLEIFNTLEDLRKNNVDIVTLGQYLQPSPKHHPVISYISPENFSKYEKEAKSLGFLYCASGPLVRSSYKAGELFMRNILKGDV
jgi:lipoyl synthase